MTFSRTLTHPNVFLFYTCQSFCAGLVWHVLIAWRHAFWGFPMTWIYTDVSIGSESADIRTWNEPNVGLTTMEYQVQYLAPFACLLLETCCIIGLRARDHLLREAWSGPLEVLRGGTCTRLGFSLVRRPWRSDHPRLCSLLRLEFLVGCTPIYMYLHQAIQVSNF
jgi:hypothetical protein